MSQPTVWSILRKRFHMKSYWLQMLQALNPQNHNLRNHCCANFQEKPQKDGFGEKVISFDEATFHLSGKVNRHNVRVWCTQNGPKCIEPARDSPKINLFCAVSASKVYRPFFFPKRTVTGVVYLDMLQQ